MSFGPDLRLWGWLTAVWVAFAVVVYPLAASDSFAVMKPNEFGDYVAGMAGPPAFLWLVLGFFQQKAELRNQIEEMKSSVAEFKAQTDLQRQSFEHERRRSELSYLHSEIDHFKDRVSGLIYFINRGVRIEQGNTSEGVSLIGTDIWSESVQALSNERFYDVLLQQIEHRLARWPEWAQTFASLVPEDVHLFASNLERTNLEYEGLARRVENSEDTATKNHLDRMKVGKLLGKLTDLRSDLLQNLKEADK